MVYYKNKKKCECMLMSKIFNEDGGRRAVNCKLRIHYP